MQNFSACVILSKNFLEVIYVIKKFLSTLVIGAFVFGVGVTSVQPVSAASIDKAKEAKENFYKSKQKFDKSKHQFDQMRDGDSMERPKPPTDKDGKPLPPPTDKDGKPLPPPTHEKKS